ncbi:MAG: RING finger protein [Clostridia bacterium]
MTKYVGVPCPICNKEFNQNDDVVVCPICGAPYHRHCYKENNACIFDELHQNGEAWQMPEVVLPTTAPENEVKDQECSKCGVLNAHSSLFCSSCGNPLKFSPNNHANRNQTNQTSNQFSPLNMGGMPMITYDPLGGVPATKLVEDNISYGEVSKIVQQNTKYYIPAFDKIKSNFKGSNKFNFSAFIFSGGWLLYRKQYKTGTIVTVLMFLLYLLQYFFTYTLSYPKLIEIFANAGMDVSTTGFTIEELIEISSTQFISYSELFIIGLPSLCTFLMFIIMLVVGFIGNKLYLKHCIQVINTTRQKSTNMEDYNTHILEKGGVDTTVTLCLLICYFIISYLPYFF